MAIGKILDSRIHSAQNFLHDITGVTYYQDSDELTPDFIQDVLANENDDRQDSGLEPYYVETIPLMNTKEMRGDLKYVLVELDNSEVAWYSIPENAYCNTI